MNTKLLDAVFSMLDIVMMSIIVANTIGAVWYGLPVVGVAYIVYNQVIAACAISGDNYEIR